MKEVLEDLDALSLIGNLAALDKRFSGLAQLVQGEVCVAPLETLVLVDELEQLEHFSSGSDLFHQLCSGGYLRILREVLVLPLY